MNNNTYCIIMAGGFGSRFWPICKDDSPKLFIDILGTGQSLLQSTFKRFECVCPRENIIIVTNRIYVDRVREQIGGLLPYQVLSEPTRRNTAPCIAYAASVIGEMNPNANVIVTPSDHAVFGRAKFEHDMEQALAITAKNDYIVTIGVPPTNPNVKYGYIQFAEESALPEVPDLHKVITFTEKPPLEMAKEFIKTGEFFWNSGLFVWRLPTLRKAFKDHLPYIENSFFELKAETPAAEVDRVYSQSVAISVDFGIMEHAENVYVLQASFGWSDVETWDSLFDNCLVDINNNGIVSGQVFAYDVRNTLVHVPADQTVVLQGLDGYIVASDGKTLMVCSRSKEDNILKYASDVELAKMKGYHETVAKLNEEKI